MKHILLPTDFSENSLHAIRYAFQLYKKQTFTAYLVHTYQFTAYHPGYFQKNNPEHELANFKQEQSETQLKKLQKSLESEFGSNNNIILISIFNSLNLGIQKILKKYPIDLIIMGTKGLANDHYIFLGTNTALCISTIDFPILIVPENAVFNEAKEILFPTDFKDLISNRFLEKVRSFATNHESRINVLNILNQDEIKPEQQENRNFLKKYFESSLKQINYIEEKTVLRGIEKFQSEHTIDLLVMVRNKHSLFENIFFQPVIYNLVYHSQIPFLVIPGTNDK